MHMKITRLALDVMAVMAHAGEPCALKSGHLEKKSYKVEAQMKLPI